MPPITAATTRMTPIATLRLPQIWRGRSSRARRTGRRSAWPLGPLDRGLLPSAFGAPVVSRVSVVFTSDSFAASERRPAARRLLLDEAVREAVERPFEAAEAERPFEPDA